MSLDVLNPYEILTVVASQQLASQMVRVGAVGNSRMVRVIPDSWQADMFRHSVTLRHVGDIDDLHAAMAENNMPVLFIGDDVVMSAEAIERACALSGNDKIILWEDGGF